MIHAALTWVKGSWRTAIGVRSHKGSWTRGTRAASLDLCRPNQKSRIVTHEGERLCVQALLSRLRLRQFDQHHLPIDLCHCAALPSSLAGGNSLKRVDVRWRALSCR